MHITKWGEYGILCALYLAENHAEQGSSADLRDESSTAVGAQEIATARGIPLQYAHQILRRLRQGNIIVSHRGPHGGYSLARRPEETTMREVLEAAEGVTFEVICETKPPYETCLVNQFNCALKPVWEELRSSINALLDSMTLASVLERHRNKMSLAEETLTNISSN